MTKTLAGWALPRHGDFVSVVCRLGHLGDISQYSGSASAHRGHGRGVDGHHRNLINSRRRQPLKNADMYNPQPSIIFLVAVVVLSAIEYRWRVRADRGYDLGALGGTVGTAIGQFLFKSLLNGTIGVAMLGVFALAPVHWPLDDWRTWLVGFFVLEFFYYWQHRLSHTIRWFWASHAVHHSANELTLPAAARLSWTSGISGLWAFFLPMTLLGFHPLLVATLLTLNLQYQYFIHTEAIPRLGPLEWILNTPAHHRVHHGSNLEYLDKNFGGVLIVFDRLFGTFQSERADTPIVYGLTKPLTSNNPFVIALHEWGNLIGDVRRADSISGVCRALFGRPGDASPRNETLDHRSSPEAAIDQGGSGEVVPTTSVA